VLTAGRTPRGLGWSLALFGAFGLGLTVLGLVGLTTVVDLPGSDLVVDALSRLNQGPPGAYGDVHANELGGSIILFLPLALAAVGMRLSPRRWLDWLARLALLLFILFLGAVLIVTRSRSAWLGLAVGLAAMAWIRWRRARWLLLAAGLAAVALVAYASLPAAGLEVQTTGEITLAGRFEIWSRALYAVQDFPWTGVGLGAFRQVVHVLYPFFLLSPNTDVGHAHNVFLQVALDLGIGGLVAYLALLGGALWLCWRAVDRGRNARRWLALGVGGALVAFHVYGLTDAIALGAKPGLALWILFGLAVVLWQAEAPAVRQLP
jgi:putative inorganic carbon (HCO3(-)) transporter